MAVPSSGTLTMLGLAQEALYGTYGSGTITSPIHLYDLVNGGNSAGSGNSYPTINQDCTPNPADRTASLLTGVEDGMGTDPPVTLYYNSTIGVASSLSVGDTLYTSSALTTTANNYIAFQDGSSATTTVCSAGYDGFISTNASGVITDIGCSIWY